MNRTLAITCLFLTLLALGACGKKPSDVVLSDDGSVPDYYPGTYPDPKSDKPGTYLPQKTP